MGPMQMGGGSRRNSSHNATVVHTLGFNASLMPASCQCAVASIEVQGVVVSIRLSMLLAFCLETQLHRDEDTMREGKSI